MDMDTNARRWAASCWALNMSERRAMARYLRGRRTCAEFDALPMRVQCAIDKAYDNTLALSLIRYWTGRGSSPRVIAAILRRARCAHSMWVYVERMRRDSARGVEFAGALKSYL